MTWTFNNSVPDQLMTEVMVLKGSLENFQVIDASAEGNENRK